MEEVASDMDMEGGSSNGEEVGMNQVAGKRRKVVRNNRFQAGKLSREELLQMFANMPNSHREWFKKHFLSDASVGVGSADGCGEGDEFVADKVEFNARAAPAPTQEDVATPCG